MKSAKSDSEFHDLKSGWYRLSNYTAQTGNLYDIMFQSNLCPVIYIQK